MVDVDENVLERMEDVCQEAERLINATVNENQSTTEALARIGSLAEKVLRYKQAKAEKERIQG